MHFSKTITVSITNPPIPQYSWKGDCPGTIGYCANSGTYYAINVPVGVTYQYSYDNSTWTSMSLPPRFYVACDQSLSVYIRAVGCSGNVSAAYHLNVRALSDKICFPPGHGQRVAEDSILSLKGTASIETSTKTFKVYPVPATDNLNILLNNTIKTAAASQSIKEVKIIDISGKITRQIIYGEGIRSTSINVSGIRPGIYIIQVFNGSVWLGQKIIIQ
ncbi:T9SS type A sorting domain-containing protein [Chitinophaga oryziterrae]|uniref:T9SS type A sorting domain-containing protein n=1 Tax=Chitinophaga oryziterrae TaxID=1031224 RepID=A0A6N8JF05_9BACT|nr:T9SS type A sorting domain-containing protein [Chitinophaga oryziterrae]MVT42899.1 T9SS type A sorting domain-containing protein [Chitinophaga oryziterrae]